MKDHDEQRQKWEYIGHRLMQSSDLQVLCGVTRKTPGAEKPFVAGLSDDELKGMITFVLDCMREIDQHSELRAEYQVLEIPYEYRDRRQEYFRLQLPKSERHRSTDLYNAEFINDHDEGYDTLQGVFITLLRALSYLFEELHYQHGKPKSVFIQALHGNYPEYAGIIDWLTSGKKDAKSTIGHRDAIKLNLSSEQLAELLSCFEIFFDPSDGCVLKVLLQGHSVDHKLVFNGNQNQLVEVFRRLSYNGFINKSRTYLRDWICENFAYISKKGLSEMSLNSVWDILSKAKGEPASKSRICKLDWLPYAKQSALRYALK